ncbi:MAG: helix-turn-helix transcriptional regulator [Parabacteroides sp.]|nr:helix-turn-helix transcriptional regulator [Parabacteroides sp.]
MNLILDEQTKKDYCKVLSEDLPVLRAKLGITQEELAIRVGKSRNMIAQIETGKKEMSWVTFVALSLLFLNNETTAAVFKSLDIFDEKVEKFLMFENHSEF